MRKTLWLIAFYFNALVFLYGKDDLNFNCTEKLSLPFVQVSSNQTEGKYNFGLSVSSENLFKNFYVSFKTGNLTPGGCFSLLNSSLLSSSITPFSVLQTQSLPLKVSFPDNQTYSKPVSYFFIAGYNNPKSVLTDSSLALFYNPTDNFLIADLFAKLHFNKKIKLGLSLCSGLFEYESFSSDSWFLPQNFYSNGIKTDTSLQLDLQAYTFKTLFTYNLYESPYHTRSSLYRIESTYTAKKLNINLGLFYNPEKVLSPSDKNILPGFQAKTGLQYTFINNHGKKIKNPLLIKTGINMFYKTGEENSFKVSTGFSIATEKNNFILSGNMIVNDGIKQSGKIISFFSTPILSSFGFNIKDSFLFYNFKFITSFKFTSDPGKNEMTEALDFSLNYNLSKTGNLNLNTSLNFDFTQKNMEYKTFSGALNISVKYNWKWFTLSGKITYILKK